MLKNTLVRIDCIGEDIGNCFEELGIVTERRAETLDITQFAALANFLFINCEDM